MWVFWEDLVLLYFNKNYADHDSALDAIEKMNDKKIDGKRIVVEFAG